MSASWPKVRLGDHVDLLSGFAFKSKQFTDDQDDIPLVKGANVHQGYIDWEKAVRWSKDEFSQYEKYHLKANDVVLAMDRPWIEAGLKFSWIKPNDPDSMLVQRVSRLRGINGLSSRYLRYVIGSPQFTNYIKPIVTGVNVPHISGGQIKDYKFNLPPELLQDQIADIIEPYDNLIENNNRRIAILEEMAHSLYREWFVKFRFPDYENVKFKDSPLGQIPEEWEVKPLKDLTSKIGSGATPRGGKGAYKTEGIPLIRSMNIYDSTFITKDLAFIDDAQALKLKNVIVEPNDVLLNITGASVARCAIVPAAFTPARVNQHVAIIRVSDSGVSPEYVLYTLISHVGKTRLLNIAQGGATREAITKVHIENFYMLIPPQEINEQFSNLATTISREKEVLFLKNENMKTQRDMLLPKLINGSIEV